MQSQHKFSFAQWKSEPRAAALRLGDSGVTDPQEALNWSGRMREPGATLLMLWGFAIKPVWLLILGSAFAFAQADSAEIDQINQLNDRGLHAVDQRQFDTAATLFQDAIARWKEKGSGYGVHAAIVQTNLAQVYCARGERRRCSAMMEDALSVIRKTLGERDLRTLAPSNVAAGVHMMIGEQARAAELFKAALPIERELYPKNVELAHTLAGLASLAMQENRVGDAAQLADESLSVAIASAGEDSLAAATGYALLAEVHRLQGQIDRAAPLYRKARAIYEAKLGPSSTRAFAVLTQQGVLAMSEGNLGTAERAFTTALGGLAKSCPSCAYERVSVENDLAVLWLRQGKVKEADNLLSDILEQQAHGDVVPAGEIATTLESLAAVRSKNEIRRH